MKTKAWPIVVLALLPLIPLWRVFFAGHAIGPHEQIALMVPGATGNHDSAWDVLAADGVLQFHVWRDLVFSAWGRGEIPFWNPYVLAGTPLMANSQSGALYPPHILVGLLHLPTAFGIALLAWLHLAWAGIGTARLAARLGALSHGQLLAGASFALSPFMLGWTPLASTIASISWIPWALASAIDLTVPASSRRAFGGLGLSIAMMTLAGHLQFVAYGAMAAGLLALILGVMRKRFVAPIAAAVAMGAGLMVAAPQLLPVLEFSKNSHRQGKPTAEGYSAYTHSAIRPFEFANLVYPMTLGSPRDRVEKGQSDLSTYWPMFVKLGGNWSESALSPGAVAMALLLVLLLQARSLKREKLGPAAASAAVVGGVFLSLAMGSELNRLLYFYFPGWSATGSPGRAIVIFVLLACVLAGLGLRFLNEVPRPLGRVLGLAYVMLGAGTIFLSSVRQEFLPFAPADIIPRMLAVASSNGLLLGLATLMVAGTVLISTMLDRFDRQRPILALAAFGVAFLMWGGLDIVSSGKPFKVETAYPVKPYERIGVISDTWSLFVTQPALYPPNVLTLSRIHEISGYDSLIDKESKQILNEIDRRDSSPEENGNIQTLRRAYDVEKLREAGVTQVWVRQSGRVDRITIDGPGRVSMQGGDAEVQGESLNRVTVTVGAKTPGTLILRDRMMPGWTARVDGKPVPLPMGRWREVQVPAGSHTVEFSYFPPSWPMAWIWFVAGLSILAIPLVVRAPIGMTPIKAAAEPVPAPAGA